MALPTFPIRSYSGGAVQATLVNPMGAGDTAFTITPTTGWSQADGNPLGTAGPFVVDINRNQADPASNEEKILCTAINLTSGVVTVWTSGGSGRGYDQTSASSHAAGDTCQVTFSAVEATEDNAAANALLGPDGTKIKHWLDMSQQTTPADPAALTDRFYTKADDALYRLTPGGTETLIGPLSFDGQQVSTAETTTSTAYTDLATPGPVVTITTGVFVLVILTCQFTASANDWAVMSFQITGATSQAPTDTYSASISGGIASASGSLSAIYPLVLTPGSNTFTAKYRTVSGNTAHFTNRWITCLRTS